MWNEADRLTALRGYDILDAPSTDVFDDFVRIAAEACAAPIAVVNLIDEARQWFAAEIGLGVRQTPLDVSICAHAILQPDVFIVPDLTQDPRFDCNPLVTGAPGLRFYGGALLQTAAGLPLGTMCVLDYAPRPAGLTEAQVFTLQALARQVMAQLELRRALRDMRALLAEKDLLVQEAHHRVTNSLATVQALLLLQARGTKHEEVAQALHESAARIRTFGAMHEHLYRVGAATEVDIALYLQSLVDDQRSAVAIPAGRTIIFEATGAAWPSADAPALGLIAVELLTNALKHGTGPVTVTFRQSEDEAVLSVEDAGCALPADFEPRHSKGLGMRVVGGLLHGHRQGRLDIDRSRGHTRFVATLKAPAAPG